jgi:drug/metabolite transporter (DMT)-like permease
LSLSPRIAALLCLPPLLWAGNAVVGRLLVGQVPSQSLNAMRWGLTLALLLPLGWRALATSESRAAVWARRGPLLRLGLFGITAYNALQYLALTTTTALNATLIAASGPVWMLLIGRVLHAERPRRRQWLGGVLSLLGVLVVVSHGDVQALARVQLVRGDALMLLAVICWAFYSWTLARPVASMRAPQRPGWDWAEFLMLQVIFGGFFAALVAGVEQVVAPQPILWSPVVLAALLYVAIGPSIIAYWIWGIGVARVGPAIAGFFGNLTPLFAALLSAFMLGEMPQVYHVIAFALVVAGIVISSRR